MPAAFTRAQLQIGLRRLVMVRLIPSARTPGRSATITSSIPVRRVLPVFRFHGIRPAAVLAQETSSLPTARMGRTSPTSAQLTLFSQIPSPDVWNSTTPVSAANTSRDLSAITALDNQANVYFRLIDNSTTSANGGTVAAAGTDRVDNFTISGTAIPAAPSVDLSVSTI